MYGNIKGICITALSVIFFSCAEMKDFSGLYWKVQGNCSSKCIELKKVKGFGERYYLVVLYENDAIAGQKGEFLGKIQGNVITVNSGTIEIAGDEIHVRIKDKSCRYKKKD